MSDEKIVPGLAPLTIDIDSVVINPANTRRHMPHGIELLMRSLRTFGQHKPIVVQKQGMLCRAGNGLLEAARQLGWKRIAAVVIDEGNVEATAREIVDNRAGEIGSEWAQEALVEQLKALQEDGFDIGATGWSNEELDALQAEFEARMRKGDDDSLPEDDSSVIKIVVPKSEVTTLRAAIEEVLKQEGVEYKISVD
jgi:hypothetical protein